MRLSCRHIRGIEQRILSGILILDVLGLHIALIFAIGDTSPGAVVLDHPQARAVLQFDDGAALGGLALADVHAADAVDVGEWQRLGVGGQDCLLNRLVRMTVDLQTQRTLYILDCGLDAAVVFGSGCGSGVAQRLQPLAQHLYGGAGCVLFQGAIGARIGGIALAGLDDLLPFGIGSAVRDQYARRIQREIFLLKAGECKLCVRLELAIDRAAEIAQRAQTGLHRLGQRALNALDQGGLGGHARLRGGL